MILPETTEKEKEAIQLTEEIIRKLEMFINGHGVCLSISCAYSSAKKLHKLLVEA